MTHSACKPLVGSAHARDEGDRPPRVRRLRADAAAGGVRASLLPGRVEFVDVCPLCQDIALDYGWVREGGPMSPALSPRDATKRPRWSQILGVAERRAASRSSRSRSCAGSPTRRRRSSRPPTSSTRASSGARSRESRARSARRSSRSSRSPGVNGELVLTFAWEITWYQYRVAARRRRQPIRLADRGADISEIEAGVHRVEREARRQRPRRPERRSLASRARADAALAPRIALMATTTRHDVPELHRRRVGGRRLRRDLRVDEPGRRRADRHLPAARAPRTSIAPWRRRRRRTRSGGSSPRRSAARSSSASRSSSSTHKDELTDLMTHEMGKVKAEAGGDVQEAIDMSYYMGGEGRRLFGQTTPSELREQVPDVGPDADRRRRRHHAVELPDRDPVLEDRARARLRGTRSSSSPRRTRRRSGSASSSSSTRPAFPKGVVNIVHGGGGAVGERLVRHPDVPVITLTGSRETGVKVLEAAAERLKHVHLELGGKNAIIVMDDADLDLALDGILWSAFGTSGQRCTADEPRDRPREPLRRARRRASSSGPRRCALGPGLGGRHRRRPGHQRRRAREDPLVHADRQSTTARRS